MKKKKKSQAKSRRHPRATKSGVASGSTKQARSRRRRAIVRTLTPLLGQKVRNTEIKKNIYILPKGVSETSHHASKSELSTIAAMDAKRQLRDAKPGATVKAKKNSRQKSMNIKYMKLMKGEIAGHPTNVNVGVTGTRQHVMYCITAKRKQKKK